MATVDDLVTVPVRRTVNKTPSLVLKPLSDCQGLPLLQRRASRGKPPGLIDSTAGRLSGYRYPTTCRVWCWVKACVSCQLCAVARLCRWRLYTCVVHFWFVSRTVFVNEATHYEFNTVIDLLIDVMTPCDTSSAPIHPSKTHQHYQCINIVSSTSSWLTQN